MTNIKKHEIKNTESNDFINVKIMISDANLLAYEI